MEAVCKIFIMTTQRVHLLQSAIESDGEQQGTQIDSSKGVSYGRNVIFTETEQHGMLDGKDYRSLDILFTFEALFIDRSKRCKRHHL